jgi:hypothetical protein
MMGDGMTLRQAISAARTIVLFFGEGNLRIKKVQANTLRRQGDWTSDELWGGNGDTNTWSLKSGQLSMHWSS